MPTELQALGNNYVRDEFKRHKKCNEQEANLFVIEWTNYAVHLSKQLGLGIYGRPSQKIGENLKVDDLDNFNEGQIVQLHELMRAARNLDDGNSGESESNATTTNPSDGHNKKS